MFGGRWIKNLKKSRMNKRDSSDGICDDCKFSIISNDDIPPTF